MLGNLNIKRLMVNGEFPTGVRIEGSAAVLDHIWNQLPFRQYPANRSKISVKIAAKSALQN